MRENPSWLPLFPLKTVLFPDGILPLKVFETRYIDMVRECMKTGAPFGVVLIKSGQEVGLAAVPEEVGSLAHIVDLDMPELGIMMLRVRGGARFRIHDTRVLPDQRLEARVAWLPPDNPAPVSEVHLQCAQALRLVIEDALDKGRAQHGRDFVNPFSDPARLDDAGWVANRWCEILPIPLKARQKLLELPDAQIRLSIIHQYLTQHRIL